MRALTCLSYHHGYICSSSTSFSEERGAHTHTHTRAHGLIHPRLASRCTRCMRLGEEHEQKRRLRDRYRVKWESKFRANRVPRVSVPGKSFLLFPILLLCNRNILRFFSNSEMEYWRCFFFFFFFWTLLTCSKGITWLNVMRIYEEFKFLKRFKFLKHTVFRFSRLWGLIFLSFDDWSKWYI